MREFKSTLPGSIKGIDGRTVTGIAAVFGNIDSVRDRLHPGSFAKTIQEAGRQAKHLWNHSFFDPPTAVIKNLQEVGRDALGAEILALAPEATGGLEVQREYLNTDRAEEIFEGIKSGAINQMSFGFDPVKWDYTNEGDGPDTYLTRIRELREVKLYDTSDVNWGANDATIASKAFNGLPLEFVLQALAQHVKSARADASGPHHSQLINVLLKAASDLGWSGPLDSAPMTSTSDHGSRAEAATAATHSTGPSLTEISARLMDLSLSTLEI